MPLVQTLFNPGLRDRHWEQISEVVKYPLKPDETYTLDKMLEFDLMKYVPQFEGISEAASKEFSLEKAMEKMKNEWAPVRYSLSLSLSLPNWLYFSFLALFL